LKWSRFVTIVKQQHKLDEVSYHKLFDILKQYQNEVNELRAERLARNANPVALVANAQADRDQYFQTSRDKDMQKNLALIEKYFKKIYKPTNNNLRTSSNSKNKNVDTTLRFKNDNQTGQFGNQRTVNVAAAQENVGSKDFAYHKEKMFLCKQAEQGVPLQAEHNTCLVETDDSNVIPDSLDMCEDDIQNEQNDVESDDERVALANLIANLKLDLDENKKIQKQLKKANTTLAQEMKEWKTILAETSKSLGESIRVRDSCLVALQTKQVEFGKFKAFNDRTIDYDILERKLNEALGQLAHKDTVIRECLKMKSYELSVVKEKHDELMKHSLLTKSHYEGLVKQKTKVITDLKLREEHDIEKMLSMEKQLKFLNEIVYKRSQSIQTIHMMAPKVPTYNGRPTFANPIYLKQAQSEIPCLYAFSYDQNTHANRLIPDGEETLALEREISESISKSRQAYNVMTNNINHFKEIIDNPWIKHSKDLFRALTAQDMEIPIQTCLMPLSIKTYSDSLKFVHELKQEMHADLKYVESLEKEIDKLESKKAEFSDMYDEILQDCVSKDVVLSYLQSLSDLHALAKLQCMYLHKVKEYDCLAQKLSIKTDSVSKKVQTELLQRFSKVEKHSISLELALKKCKEQVKNDIVCNEKASNVFRKQREQYFKIQDLKAQLQDKNIPIRVNHKPTVSRPQLKSNQSRDKVLPNNSQGDLVQGNVTINRVYYVEGLNYNLFSVGQFCGADLEVAFRKSACFVRDLQSNDLLVDNRGFDLYTISLQESTSSTPLCLMAKATPTQAWLWHRRLSHLNFDHINLLLKKDIVIGLPKLKYVKDQLCSSCELSNSKRSSFKSKAVPSSKGRLNLLHMDLCGPMRVASINGKKYILSWRKSGQDEGKGGSVLSDYDNPDLVPQRQDVTSSADADVPSQQELDLLFGPLYDEFFNAGSNPLTNIQSTSSPSTHTNVSEYQWTKDHPLEQVRGNTSRTVQTRRQLATDPEMCMYALTVSTAEPKNIKEAMADSAWIEAMQEELHQFDRLQVWKALYGLKQALRAWYDELSKFLTSKGFTKGTIDPTLFMIRYGEDILLVQIYAKYTLEILHKNGMDKGQSIGTPMATKPKLDADLSGNPVDQIDYRSKIGSLMYFTSSRPDIVQEDSSFELTAFSDDDHAGCIDSCKSTSGGIQFLGDKLVSWMSKKQNCTAMSSVEAKYVALSTSCAQVMWRRTQLQDYGFNYNKIPLYSIPDDRFKYLVRRIGFRCLTPAELEGLAKESA
nr:retrovirus-related Pol polyprotein from transposon TNT 1-94 [Tanacetum cinerariifolium]